MYSTIHIRSILHIAAEVLCPRKLLMNGQISVTCRKDGDMLSRAFVTTVIFRVARHLMPGTMLTVSAQDAPKKVDCGLGARIVRHIDAELKKELLYIAVFYVPMFSRCSIGMQSL